MKKIFTALCLIAFLSACSSLYRNPEQEKLQAEADEAYRKSVSVWKEKRKERPVQVKTTENVEILPLIKGRVSKFKTPKPNPTVAEIEEEIRYKEYANKYQRLIENVVIKDKSETDITYEYKDARVDELAFMAVQYCKEQDKRQAFLQKVTLFKNKARRATFSCRRL